jgi:hypothetical protein
MNHIDPNENIHHPYYYTRDRTRNSLMSISITPFPVHLHQLVHAMEWMEQATPNRKDYPATPLLYLVPPHLLRVLALSVIAGGDEQMNDQRMHLLTKQTAQGSYSDDCHVIFMVDMSSATQVSRQQGCECHGDEGEIIHKD